ncbi:hypothetical protein ACFL47_02690 [Candidatus Latescibacterota bacterium]
MKSIPFISVILTSAILLGGCAAQKDIHVRLSEPWRLDYTPDSYGTLPASSPEHCHNALLKGYQEDSDRGRIQVIRYVNTMFDNWANHPYITNSAYLAGWSVLFADTGHRAVAVSSDTVSWGRYIDSLLTASYYFEISARKDSSPDGFWTSATGAPLGVIHEGFEGIEALRLYLEAQRLAKITYLRTQDEKTLVDAVKIMEAIEDKYPQWALQYGVVVDKQETINAITMNKTRRVESLKIFGE